MTANPSSENQSAAAGTQDVRGSGLSVASGSALRLNFVGHKYDYSVHLRLPQNANDKGYVGAFLTAKHPREGEDWKRGNDLADGPLTQETLDRIAADIAKHDLPNSGSQTQPPTTNQL